MGTPTAPYSASIPAGTISNIAVGTTNLAVEDCDFTGEVDVDDVTHTLANGYQVLVPTIYRFTATCSGGYDQNPHYHANPPNVVPGQTVTLTLTPDGVKNYPITAVVTKFHWKGGPKNGAVRFDAEFRGSGYFANAFPTN